MPWSRLEEKGSCCGVRRLYTAAGTARALGAAPHTPCSPCARLPLHRCALIPRAHHSPLARAVCALCVRWYRYTRDFLKAKKRCDAEAVMLTWNRATGGGRGQEQGRSSLKMRGLTAHVGVEFDGTWCMGCTHALPLPLPARTDISPGPVQHLATFLMT